MLKLHPFGKKLALFLMVILTFPLQFSCLAYAQTIDPLCIHGMRIVGEQSIYLSHMGLFNSSCHDYQGLFEVSFSGSKNPQKIYLDAQKKDSSQNEFTIQPTQKFVLSDLATGKLTSFKAEIYSGQYERTATSPKLLDGNVTVTVNRVLHFRRFAKGAKQPVALEYLLFGSTSGPLAAHLITASPDFDQIVAVKTPLTLTNADWEKVPVRLVLPNRKSPNVNVQLNSTQALIPGVNPTVQLNGLPPNQSIIAGTQYFLETCDYNISPINSCP
jgi:hypothetical protein